MLLEHFIKIYIEEYFPDNCSNLLFHETFYKRKRITGKQTNTPSPHLKTCPDENRLRPSKHFIPFGPKISSWSSLINYSFSLPPPLSKKQNKQVKTHPQLSIITSSWIRVLDQKLCLESTMLFSPTLC